MHEFGGIDSSARGYVARCSCGWASFICTSGWDAAQQWGGHQNTERPKVVDLATRYLSLVEDADASVTSPAR